MRYSDGRRSSFCLIRAVCPFIKINDVLSDKRKKIWRWVTRNEALLQMCLFAEEKNKRKDLPWPSLCLRRRRARDRKKKLIKEFHFWNIHTNTQINRLTMTWLWLSLLLLDEISTRVCHWGHNNISNILQPQRGFCRESINVKLVYINIDLLRKFVFWIPSNALFTVYLWI